MALITEDLRIPAVGDLFPTTRRRHKVKPCGTGAARRRHFRRHEPQDDLCRAWHAEDMRRRRSAGTVLSVLEPGGAGSDQGLTGPDGRCGGHTPEKKVGANAALELHPWPVQKQRAARHEVPGHGPEAPVEVKLSCPASTIGLVDLPEDYDVLPF